METHVVSMIWGFTNHVGWHNMRDPSDDTYWNSLICIVFINERKHRGSAHPHLRRGSRSDPFFLICPSICHSYMSFSRLRISEIYRTNVVTDGFCEPLAVCSSTIGIATVINFVVDKLGLGGLLWCHFRMSNCPYARSFFPGIQSLTILVTRPWKLRPNERCASCAVEHTGLVDGVLHWVRLDSSDGRSAAGVICNCHVPGGDLRSYSLSIENRIPFCVNSIKHLVGG